MRLAFGVVAICALLLIAVAAPAMAQGAFSDVPKDHWAYDAVDQLAQAGIVIGYPDGTFKGQRQMTRYEFAMAISRLMGKGLVGPAGPVGPAGAVGPVGPAGKDAVGGTGAGLTKEQADLLDRLKNEFAPELRTLRSDVEDAVVRIEALEKAAGLNKGPRINLGGSISYRTGLYGTSLKINKQDTTGFPSASSMAKDASKANTFGTMVTKLKVSGDVTPDVKVKVVLVAEPRTNSAFELSEPTSDGISDLSDGAMSNLGIMDIVRVDEAWAKVSPKFMGPFTAKIGKQYWKVNQGLAIDNELMALKGVDIGLKLGRGIMVNGILAHFDREAFADLGLLTGPTDALLNNGQDKYTAATLMVPLVKDWSVTGAYVNTSLGDSRLWSVGAEGKLFNRKVYGEFARAVRDVDSVDINDEQNAWVVGANLLNTSTLTLGAKYGQVDENYAFGGSRGIGVMFPTVFTPYAAISPHDIDWVDRPLFLDPDNISRGWEVCVAYKGLANGTMPVKLRYYDGDRNDYSTALIGDRVKGDAVVTVSIAKDIAKDVTATLLYGRREVKHDLGGDQDPVQVLRGEFALKF